MRTFHPPISATSVHETARSARAVPRARMRRVRISCPTSTMGADSRTQSSDNGLAPKMIHPTNSHAGSTKAAGISHR